MPRSSKAELELSCVSAIDSNGERFVVHADEKLTAFLELESVIQGRGELV